MNFITHLPFFSDHGHMPGSQGLSRGMHPYGESITIPFSISGGQPSCEGHPIGRRPVLPSAPGIAPAAPGLCGLRAPEWMRGGEDSAFCQCHEDSSEPSPPDLARLQCIIPTATLTSPTRPSLASSPATPENMSASKA